MGELLGLMIINNLGFRSSTRGPEDDSVESKHVAPL